MSTHTSPDMLAYYAARAPIYDAVYMRPERQDDIAFFQRHIPERLAGRRVLEVACGTGYWTPGIAARAQSVVATDANEAPMAFARLRPGANWRGCGMGRWAIFATHRQTGNGRAWSMHRRAERSIAASARRSPGHAPIAAPVPPDGCPAASSNLLLGSPTHDCA